MRAYYKLMAKLTTLLTLTFATLLLAGSAYAADVTGKWSGTVTVKTPDGQANEQPAWMSLKQVGSALTGTAGPAADRQSTIQEGKVDGDRVEFKVSIEDAVVNIRLRADAEQLKGEAIIETPDGKMTASLNLKRVP